MRKEELSIVFNSLKKQLDLGIDKHYFMNTPIGVHAITGCDTISVFSCKEKRKAAQLLQRNAMKGTSELWRVTEWSGQYLTRPLKIPRSSCVSCTERSARVWMCCTMRSTAPEARKSNQRLCRYASHLYDFTLQEQIIKQQSEEKP